jgi:hypothetical protein
MKIAGASGNTVVVYPLLEHAEHLVQRVVVDGGAIRMDSPNHSLDESHLVLDGVLTAGQDYFKLLKNGEKLLNADHTGKLFAHKGIASPEITALESTATSNTAGLTTVSNAFQAEDQLLRTDIDSNTAQITLNSAEIASATHAPTHDSIVKRNNNGTTEFHDITTNILSANQAMALYGDATLQYVPQDEQGQNLVGYTYRFGHNSEEIGDLSGVGAGLEMKDLLDNHLLVQVNRKTPHVEIKQNKIAGIPYLLIRDSSNNPQIEINQEGFAQKYHIYPNQTMTPGTKLTLNMREGPQVHRLEFATAWTNSTSESIIQFQFTASAGEYRVIENLEVMLDDLAQPIPVLDTFARVYIKRWGVYRNVYQMLYVVLGVEFDPNQTEVEIEAYSLLRITFNNKQILT